MCGTVRTTVGTGPGMRTNASCVKPFHANGFDHYIFNFARVDSTGCSTNPNNPNHCAKYVDFFINSTHIVLDKVLGIQNQRANWADQLVGAIQLDGDNTGDSYTAYADLVKITYQ